MYEIDTIYLGSSPKRARPAEPAVPPARTFVFWTGIFHSVDTPTHRYAVAFHCGSERETHPLGRSASIPDKFHPDESDIVVQQYMLYDTLYAMRSIFRSGDTIILGNDDCDTPLCADSHMSTEVLHQLISDLKLVRGARLAWIADSNPATRMARGCSDFDHTKDFIQSNTH